MAAAAPVADQAVVVWPTELCLSIKTTSFFDYYYYTYYTTIIKLIDIHLWIRLSNFCSMLFQIAIDWTYFA